MTTDDFPKTGLTHSRTAERQADPHTPRITLRIFITMKTLPRELLALSFWIYAITKLFIFDLDIFIISHTYPQLAQLLPYKIFIIAIGISVLLLITRSLSLTLFLGYVAFYPFIILLVHLPLLILRQRSWLLAFAFANSVISFFYSFKLTFIIFTTLSIALVAIAILPPVPALLWTAVVVSLAALAALYARRLILAFKPSKVLEIYVRLFPSLRSISPPGTFDLDPGVKELSTKDLSEEQLKKWTSTLQMAVLYNRICLFVAKHIGEYHKSRLHFVSYALSLVFLSLVTIIVFAAINLALFKIEPGFFAVTHPPTVFSFLYYSFNMFFHTSTSMVTATSPVSQTIVMLEVCANVLLLVLLASLFFVAKHERHVDDLRNVVAGLEREGHSMEALVADQHHIGNINEAIQVLVEVKSDLIGLIAWFTARL